MYFSPSGNNANPGTLASPKRDLSGININTIQPMDLLFQREGSYTLAGTVRFSNSNVNATNRLVLRDYGTGAKPRIVVPSGIGFEWNTWGGTTMYAGYEFRNLVIDGMGNAQWGIWFRGPMNAIAIDNCEITGFQLGIHSSTGESEMGSLGARITNNRITRNSSMGVLGTFSNSVFENNYIAENNFSGSTWNHGTYLSGGVNVTVRNNLYYRNSVVDGVAMGGNCTFHGQFDGLLVEGNRIEQAASDQAAWQMSITTGYTSAEWFRNLVVRGNWFVNGGNSAMVVHAAPGALVEQNVIVNTQGTRQAAIAFSYQTAGGGDDTTVNAVMRNNRAYVTNGSVAEFVIDPGAGSMSGNTVTQGLPTEQYVGFNPALLTD